MTTNNLRHVLLISCAFTLAACGGGGGGGGGGPTPDPVMPPDEVTDDDYITLSDRSMNVSADMVFVALEGQTPRTGDVTVFHGTGAVSGNILNGTDLDSGDYLNPANGEYSRVVRLSNDNVFGVVGLEVLPGDLPASGTVVSYNEGWVNMTAAFESEVLVLTGDAEFTATFGGGGGIDGRFFNLSGDDQNDDPVTLVGTIDLTNGSISGDSFSGGAVSGTGVFADLGGGGTTSDVRGSFFGPEAEELGGIIIVDDRTDDILVVGAFQAD